MVHTLPLFVFKYHPVYWKQYPLRLMQLVYYFFARAQGTHLTQLLIVCCTHARRCLVVGAPTLPLWLTPLSQGFSYYRGSFVTCHFDRRLILPFTCTPNIYPLFIPEFMLFTSPAFIDTSCCSPPLLTIMSVSRRYSDIIWISMYL